jgi:hypothetical protein
MIERSTLARWAQIPDGADRYLRPLVARGPLDRGGAAIVGVNPATAIGPADVGFEQYLDLLLDLDAFTAFYRALRIKRGKRPTSPTRLGLNGMAGWLSSMGWHNVLDTNVSPYPTGSAEELGTQPAHHQARHVLAEVMSATTPAVVVVHGTDALSAFVTTLAPSLAARTDGQFSDLVTQRPHFGRLSWHDGSTCEVFVCPHLRFFGRSGGERFAALHQALTATVTRQRDEVEHG